MKFILKGLVLSIVFTQVLFFAGPKVFAETQNQDGAQSVSGIWDCESVAGQQATLVIGKEYFDLHGDQTRYSMVPGAIRVQGTNGLVNYYYTFRGESLVIAFPDGDRIICEKAVQEARKQ